MIELSADQNHIRICIPVSDVKDINRYHKSLINVLDRVEIDDCNPEFRENLITVYELLSHLVPSKEFFTAEKEAKSQVEPYENIRKMM
jgi:hypothetical protein